MLSCWEVMLDASSAFIVPLRRTDMLLVFSICFANASWCIFGMPKQHDSSPEGLRGWRQLLAPPPKTTQMAKQRGETKRTEQRDAANLRRCFCIAAEVLRDGLGKSRSPATASPARSRAGICQVTRELRRRSLVETPYCVHALLKVVPELWTVQWTRNFVRMQSRGWDGEGQKLTSVPAA
jgi:hypothetical protein